MSRVLTWTEHGRPRQRIVALTVVTTKQPFGGERRWWQCPTPSCQRRSRYLLVLHLTGPIACRRCLAAQYLSDYPTRHRNRRLAQLLAGFLATGAIDDAAGPALDALLAKRRRGVRRGRRVQQRAIRELSRLPTRLTRAMDLLAAYEA